MRSRRRKIALAGGLLAVCLGAVEAGSRLLVPAALFAPSQPAYRHVWDLPYTLQPGLECSAYGADLETNSHGYRGPEWADQRPMGSFRIALVGDAHAFGLGVAYGETLGERLAAELSRLGGVPCEALNFALPGLNTRSELAVLRRDVMRFRPDLVLVVLSEDDHLASAQLVDGTLHGDPALEGAGGPRPYVDRGSWLSWSRFWAWVRLVRWRAEAAGEALAHAAAVDGWMARLGAGSPTPALRAAVLAPLLEMAAECRRRGILMVLASLAADPDYRRVAAEFEVRTGCAAVELLTFFPEVRSRAELFARFGIGWSEHLDAEGLRRCAAGTARVVTERGLLPTGRR